jgi:hypothetical protein
MKLNKKKISALLGVGLISALTFVPTLNTHAALSAPGTYHINYRYNATTGTYHLGNTSIGSNDNDRMVYTRTTDSTYFNYTSTANSTTHSHRIPNGFSITHTFNRSNTSWISMVGGYRPVDTKIGSNSSVGDVLKNEFIFDNQTANDYILYFDRSSSGGAFYYTNYYDAFIYGGYYDLTYLAGSSNLNILYVPALTKFTMKVIQSSNADYFDAWYLRDLGTSLSYNTGYDAGYDAGEAQGYADGLNNNPNILLNGFQAMVGILVNFVLMIVNLEVFGVSILGVFSIVVLFTGIVWVLKLIRG